MVRMRTQGCRPIGRVEESVVRPGDRLNCLPVRSGSSTCDRRLRPIISAAIPSYNEERYKGALGKLMAGLPGVLGSLSGLAGGFKSLGMGGGMIGNFIPVILSFVQSKGGEGAQGILEKALKK